MCGVLHVRSCTMPIHEKLSYAVAVPAMFVSAFGVKSTHMSVAALDTAAAG